MGFGGTHASELVKSMGLSISNPVFRSKKEEELYQAVKDMMEHNTFGVANDLRRKGQLHLFLSLISEGITIEEAGENGRADNYVRRAVEFIQSNYCNPIKITDVADYVCINRSYLYTLFHNATGMPPQQFLSTFRITKATELLQMTSLSVESIALSCGYTDPLVFSK